MGRSLITWSIVAQLGLMLLVWGIPYFREIDSANSLTATTMTGFLEVLVIGPFWGMAMWELLPGLFFVWLGLPLIGTYFLIAAKLAEKPVLWVVLFNVAAAIWILLPIIAGSFGDYRGP